MDYTQHPVPEYKVIHVEQAPPLEPAELSSFWRSIPSIKMYNTMTGEKEAIGTEARICCTADALHILFYCEDQVVFNEYKERDDPLYEQEVVEMFIAPGKDDPKEYREFELSPFNVIWDGIIFNPTGNRKDMSADIKWNAETLKSSVRIVPAKKQSLPFCTSWYARLTIDFKDLSRSGQPPKPGEVWRANFLRVEIKPKEHYLAWSPTLVKPANYHVPSRFGKLIF